MIDADRQSLAGVIERVTFHNPETGFVVLRVEQPKSRDLVTVVGSAPSAAPGEAVEAVGRWVVDRERGPQFKADSLRIAPPTSVHGLERYLASGAVKGVGPHLAGKIVRLFGAQTADVLDREPGQLRNIQGIGPKKLEAIKASWREQTGVRELMVFLHAHGVSSARAVRIFRTYGADAATLIRENPYRLAEDIRGIGFKTADELARKLGAPRDSPFRIRAALSYALQELTHEGHVGCPETEALAKTHALTGVPVAEIAPVVEPEVARQRLVRESHLGAPWLFLPALHAAEMQTAKAILRLSRAERHPFGDTRDWDRTLAYVEKFHGVTLADAQRAAIRLAVHETFTIVTGGPGVGKTTLVKCLLAMFAARGLKAALAAPTGRAAKRLAETSGQPAKTIHRLLEFDAATGGFKRDADNPLAGDLFVIDEASMLDVTLACQLLRAVPTGAAVVLVGDADQLPSVGPGAVLADAIASEVVPTTRLSHVFRQGKGSRIVEAAHAIRAGQLPPERDPNELSDFYFIAAEEPDAVVERILKVVKERAPARFGFDPKRDVQVLAPMNRGVLGARNLNQVLQAALNPPAGQKEVQVFGTTFRVGDRVLQTVNNYDRGVFNGDLGVVAAVDADDRELTVAFDDRQVAYDFSDLDELALAYCLTIHKSQGSEYPCVVMPIHTQHYMMLQRNLVYTGLTRGKRLVVIVGSKRALALAAGRQDSKRRYTALVERLQGPS